MLLANALQQRFAAQAPHEMDPEEPPLWRTLPNASYLWMHQAALTKSVTAVARSGRTIAAHTMQLDMR
jgi:hypothetical protein